MKARTILLIHTIFFFSFTTLSLASPFLMAYHPDVFSGKVFVFAFGLLALLTIGSWPLYRGDFPGACPFTVWENNARKREGKKPYRGACIDRYARKWFGIHLPKHFTTWFPVGVLILPIVLGIAYW